MDWNWWLKSDGGLAARIGLGAAVLLALALADLHRNRSRATRWREYTFLLACVVAALVYGVVNDQITTTISWEYFAYGKFPENALPVGEPPNSPRFRWEAAKVGMKATWTAGLIVGVALLIANNPRRDGRPRLAYRRLLGLVPLVFLVTAATAACFGVAGYFGAFLPLSGDFREMVEEDQWRPRRFMAVYGVHLGGYVGGLIATVLAVARVALERRRLAGGPDPRAL